jgi:Transglycosylase SLT domain
MWAVQNIMMYRTGGMIISVFLGGSTISFASDLQNVPNSDVISIGNDATPSKTGMSASEFKTRWGDTNDDLVLDSNWVIQSNFSVSNLSPAIAPSTPNGSDLKIVKPLKFYLEPSGVVLPRGADAAKCGPSPLSTDEIQALVRVTAKEFEVDEDFALAITSIESSFDQIRNSPKGARGPMQLIPATAKRFKVADVCDPGQNIRGGVKYLRALFDEFSNPLIVAAAYNAGEARIYEYGGIPPFDETLNYVAKVIDYQLGIDVPKAKQRHTDVNQKSRETHIAQGESPSLGVARPRKGEWVAGVLQF